MRHVISVGFLFLVAALVIAQEQARVPDRFHGKWAGSESRCARPSESTLYISENQLDFWESRGRVLSVKSGGKLEIELELELTGEGSVWRETRQFRLSEDGHTLTDVTRIKYPFARIRCGNKPPVLKK